MRAPIVLLLAASAVAQTVRSNQELRDAVAHAGPGARILVAAGEYPGGFHFANLRGAAGKPVTIAAADPENPPVFQGGDTAIHLSGAEHVELDGLVLSGQRGNGLNVDDGGSYDRPSRHVVLKNLRIRDVGPRGNCDGIKLSGVDDFRVENCTIERWGAGGGSAIDMVGCHAGVIEGCTFRDNDGGTGVQAKGGCADVVVRRCRFENAGARGVNLGGSTGRSYFRPPLGEPPHAEARRITVEGCTFVGSDAPVAFVGVDGAVVRGNTIWMPRRWALRILQETTEPGFVPCRKGEFTRNLVVFRSTQWREGGVNVGPGTEPQSFAFAQNWWFCADDPAQSRPRLPVAERDGVVGRDPRVRDADRGDVRLAPGSPAKGYGAEERERP